MLKQDRQSELIRSDYALGYPHFFSLLLLTSDDIMYKTVSLDPCGNQRQWNKKEMELQKKIPWGSTHDEIINVLWKLQGVDMTLKGFCFRSWNRKRLRNGWKNYLPCTISIWTRDPTSQMRGCIISDGTNLSKSCKLRGKVCYNNWKISPCLCVAYVRYSLCVKPLQILRHPT